MVFVFNGMFFYYLLFYTHVTGELGWEFYHDRSETEKLYDALLVAGEPFGIGDFGVYAMNVFRIEKGFRMWGQEVSLILTGRNLSERQNSIVCPI